MKVTKGEHDEMGIRDLGDLVEVIQNGTSFMCVATYNINLNFTLVRLDGKGLLSIQDSSSSNTCYSPINETSLTFLAEALRTSKSVSSFAWYSKHEYELALRKKVN